MGRRLGARTRSEGRSSVERPVSVAAPRPTRRPARGRLALLVVGLVALVSSRGDRAAGSRARENDSRLTVAEVAEAALPGRRVIFLGLDGGDWELLDRYVASGEMPNLASLLREGTGGVLLSIHPALSPLVWTTMMTGTSPLEHRILDFTRLNPFDGRQEPITSDERRLPAIWNMASYGRKTVASFGLWATYPAESVNGLMVSDRLFSALFVTSAPNSGLVHPPGRAAWARRALGKAEAAGSLSALKEYLPWLQADEYGRSTGSADPYAHPVSALRRILVETRTYHDLALDWLRTQEPDLTLVYFQGTDSIGHAFAPYAPPHQRSVSADDYERYSQVPARYFHQVDRMIGEYRRVAEASGAVLMLASDHGFRWNDERPTRLSSFAHASAAEWHRNEGIYLVWGRGILPAPGHPHRATVEQVCSTLLCLLGLPPSGEHPALPGLGCGSGPSIDYTRLYRPAAPAPPEENLTPTADEDALAKLRALGYVAGGPEPARARLAGSTRTAGSFANEALILRLQGRRVEAVAAAEDALRLDPQLGPAQWCLSDLLWGAGRDGTRSDELLVGAFASGLPGGIRYLATRAEGYRAAGEARRGKRLLEAATRARPNAHEAWLALGRFKVDQGACVEALADVQRALQLAPDDPVCRASEGLARLCLGDAQGAEKSLHGSGTSVGQAHQVLAKGALARGDLSRAVAEARLATGDRVTEAQAALVRAEVSARRGRLPEALAILDEARRPAGASGTDDPVSRVEYLRGDVLARLGRATEAEAAFRAAIQAFPQNTAAYARLAVVYALQKRSRSEIDAVLESMYEASHSQETAFLAAKTLEIVGDREGAEKWRARATESPRPGTTR